MNDDVSLRKTTEAENPAQHGDMRPSTAHDGGEREATAPARAQNVPSEVVALARRVVACNGWRWMPGMRAAWGPEHGDGHECGRVLRLASPGSGLPTVVGELSVDAGVWAGALPDLSDWATLGCLLHLVVSAHPRALNVDAGWGYGCDHTAIISTMAGAVDAEGSLALATALVMTLEAAEAGEGGR